MGKLKLREQHVCNEDQILNQSVWFKNFSDSIQLVWAGVVRCRKLKVAKKIHPLVTITVLSINEPTFQNEYLTPEAYIQTQSRPCEICSAKNGDRTGHVCLPVLQDPLISIIPQMLDPHVVTCK